MRSRAGGPSRASAASSPRSPATLTEITSTEGSDLTVADFEPVEIAPGSLVNLADPPADLTLTGDFEAGDFVKVSLGFDTGERTAVEVPVVPNSGYFEGLDGEPAPADEPSDTESATQ